MDINLVKSHPQKNRYWRSFIYTPEEERDIFHEICDGIYTKYDELDNKIPNSDFSLVEYHRCSIFRRLLISKQLDRLNKLAKNIAYYPHDLDIIQSLRKGEYKISIILINNRRYNPLFSDHNMMTLELKDDLDVYDLYMKKYNDIKNIKNN